MIAFKDAIDAETTPMECLILNADVILRIDMTAVDMLSELHQALTDQHITFAMTCRI